MKNQYKKINIGNIELINNVIVPPMAGVTDVSFRYILNKYAKPAMIYTEMVNARAVVYEDKKTMNMLKKYEKEYPVCFQIFGDEPEIMGKAAKKLSSMCDILDINMGCPAPKIVKGGGGSDLLKDLDRAKKIIDEVISNSSVPVTLKMRLGWDRNSIVCFELAKYAQDAGIKSLTIHGRTRSEQYMGLPTYDEIKKVKEIVTIPVFANGNITTLKEAMDVLNYTKADGIAIGRATLSSPYRLKSIIEGLENIENIEDVENYTESAIKENKKNICNVLKEQFEYMVKEEGINKATREIRKYIIWYSEGIKNSKKIRGDISKVVDEKSFNNILDRLREEIDGI